MNTHRLGVNSNYLVTRRLKLAGPLTEKFDQIESELLDLIGVNSAVVNIAKRELRIAYDASKRQLADVETVIADQGCQLRTHRWDRFKRSWYRYFDQNIKENAAKEPWRCH